MKTVEEYMASGMDERTARYFASGRRRIVSARAIEGYSVSLVFDNGEKRVLDCKDCFFPGSVFNKIAATDDFARVFVDDSGNLAWDIDANVDSNKVWNNRIDCCRDACYLKSVPAS